MNISAKVEYAIRALLEMGARHTPASAETLAELQEISPRFLFAILTDLRRAGLVVSQRGPEGGYRLKRPASEITPADVIRAVDGPVSAVRSVGPDAVSYNGAAVHLRDLWIAARASLLEVLDGVTLADILSGRFPDPAAAYIADPESWQPETGPYGPVRRRKAGAAVPPSDGRGESN